MIRCDKAAAVAKTVRGTREWAVAEINCCNGCPHGCRYCYARFDLVERRRILTPEEWPLCRVVAEDVAQMQPLDLAWQDE